MEVGLVIHVVCLDSVVGTVFAISSSLLNVTPMQISDGVYLWIGRYKGDKYGHAISMEFALFITVFLCALGGAAFLASTLTVERDRRVSMNTLLCQVTVVLPEAPQQTVRFLFL